MKTTPRAPLWTAMALSCLSLWPGATGQETAARVVRGLVLRRHVVR